MIRRLSGATLVAALIVLTAAAAPSAFKGWTLLGERAVTDRADHDIISVTGDRGTFRQIKLTVRRAGVDFRRVVVHYGNGGDQSISLKGTIRAGGESRAIDLEGNDRVIRSVEFWYDANSRGRQGIVRLYGKD
jgi:hypothetical protein